MDVARTPRRPARAETVGSLLRPKELREAIDRFYVPGHSAVLEQERAKDRDELLALEDEAIRSAVRRQIDCGLDVVTDGEFRRWMFMNSFYDAVDGVRTGKTVAFRNDRGEDVRLNIHEIVGRLSAIDSPGAREAAFMTDIVGGYPFKVTFPAPSIFGHPLTTVVGTGRGRLRVTGGVRLACDRDRTRTRGGCDRGRRPIHPVRLPALSVPGRPRVDRTLRICRSLGRTGARRRRSRRTPPWWRASPTTSRRRSTSVEATSGRRGCARARSSRSRSGIRSAVRHVPGRVGRRRARRRVRADPVPPRRGDDGDGPCVVQAPRARSRRTISSAGWRRRLRSSAGWIGSRSARSAGSRASMVGNEIDEDVQWRKLELVGRVAARIWG